MTTPRFTRTVIVLRHGQSVANADGVWQGQLDAPLSPVGRAQAEAAAAVLVAAYDVRRVIASDLARAADTGAAVAAAAGVPLATDPGLREVDAGQWTGMRTADVAAENSGLFDRLRAGEDVRRGGDGETVADAVARAVPVVRTALAGLDRGALVIATHGATGRGLTEALAGLDPSVHWRAFGRLGNASWAQLDDDGSGGWWLVGWDVSVSPSG